MNNLEKTENLPALQTNTMMPSAQEFQMLQVIAKNAQDSGLYAGVGQQAKIFMVLLAARELGVSPMLALNGGIWNISGKIEISARLMNGLIRRAGHSIKIIISNDTHCTLLGTRTDGDGFECSFNMEDAIKAGLSGGNVWKKYPADMLYNRCMSRLARRLFSDVIGNSYVEGEIREAKEVEKLEQVECEEITHKKESKSIEFDEIERKNLVNKESIHILKDENKHDSKNIDAKMDHFRDDPDLSQNKISSEQLSEIIEGMKHTDFIFKEYYYKYMKSAWNVSNYSDLPEKAYKPTIAGIQRNVELNAKMKAG